MDIISILQLSKSYKSKNLDPKEVTEFCIDVANKYKHLNCFIRACPDKAREKAEESSKRWQSGMPRGNLDGIPIAIKDNFCVQGMPTTCASKYKTYYSN